VTPIAGSGSCLATRMGYVVSGQMKAVMDDGEEMESGPEDVALMPPGHEARAASIRGGGLAA
jgi:mannose-6-phosphate isomerase-like protein (cupin superfamily)